MASREIRKYAKSNFYNNKDIATTYVCNLTDFDERMQLATADLAAAKGGSPSEITDWAINAVCEKCDKDETYRDSILTALYCRCSVGEKGRDKAAKKAKNKDIER